MAPPASQLSSPATTHCVTMIVPSMSKITIRRGSTWIGIIIRRSTRSSTAPIQTEKFSLSPWPKYLWSLYLSLSQLQNSGSWLHRKDPHGSSSEWIKDLLNVINKLAFHQWQHRNDSKHKTVCTHHKRAIQLLKKAIIQEYQLGSDTLLLTLNAGT